jgi:hypothetical protein
MMRSSGFESRPLLWLLLALLGSSAAPAKPPEKPADKPRLKLPALVSGELLKEDPNDDPLRKLLKARYNAALSEARDYFEFEHLTRHSAVDAIFSQDELYALSQRVVQSGLEACDTPAEKIALLSKYVDFAKAAERTQEEWRKAGRCRAGAVHRARYERLGAEVQLLRVKREMERRFDEVFMLSVPVLTRKLKQGEARNVTIAIKRGKRFDDDVTLKFEGLPPGITIEPANPVIRGGDTKATVTVKVADGAAVGAHIITVVGHPNKGADARLQIKIMVDK